MKPIRIVLADDHTLVRSGLKSLLSGMQGVEVVAEATNGKQAVDLVGSLNPDVVLTDIEMPHMTGLELAGEIKKNNLKTRVVIVTTFARSGFLRRALEVGASGYLLKDTPASQLAEAVRRVHAGGRAIDPNLAAEAWSEPDPLTDRERQVLRLASDGRSSGAIAGELNLSEGTVRNYLSEAISKLGADNRIEAARIARGKGWL